MLPYLLRPQRPDADGLDDDINLDAMAAAINVRRGRTAVCSHP